MPGVRERADLWQRAVVVDTQSALAAGVDGGRCGTSGYACLSTRETRPQGVVLSSKSRHLLLETESETADMIIVFSRLKVKQQT